MRLLDADVVIDLIRGYRPAREWIAASRGETFLIPGHVVMELIRGARNQQELNRILNSVVVWEIVWPEAADCARALADFATYRLSHNLSASDALIGQTAVGIGVPLCTFNIRHFRLIRDLVTEQPYER